MLLSGVFTFKDEFFIMKNLEQGDILNEKKKEKIKKLNGILQEFKNISVKSNIAIDQIYFLNSYLIRNPNTAKNQAQKEMMIFSRCFQEILKSISIYKEKIKPVYYYNSLSHLITDSYNKFSMTNKAIDPTVLIILYDYAENTKIAINTILKEFLANIEDPQKIKINEEKFYGEIESIINTHIKEEGGKETKFNRANFINLITDLSSNPIMKVILERIQKIIFSKLKQFLMFVKSLVGDHHFSNIFNLNHKFELSANSEWTQQERDSFGIIFMGTIASTGFNAIAGSLAVRLGLIAAEAMVPGLGWLAIGFTALTTIYALKDCIGLFDNEKCFVDIMKGFCESIKNKKVQMLEKMQVEIDKLFHSCLQKVAEYKEMERKIDDLKQEIIAQMEGLGKDPEFKSFDFKPENSKNIWELCFVEEIFPDEEWMELFLSNPLD